MIKGADDYENALADLAGALSILNRPDEEEFEVQSEQDRFELIEVLGEGALKEVSHCYDRKAKRAVALARIKPGLESEYDQGLLHEAWLTASLQHPNIIKVYTVEKDAAGRAYFTMDLKDDRTLADLASSVKRVETSLEAFLKVCDAVAYAHSQAIIHLDLKPENIQCSQYGEVLVCDWGLSKRLSLEDEDLPNMDHLLEVEQKTLYGEVKGSLGYLAPEQVQPGGIKDHRTDIYALGALLYYLFTGQPSIRGDKQEVLRKTMQGEVSPPRQLGAKMTRVQERIIMKALALAPQDRYQTVEALQDDLRHSMQGLPTSEDPPNIFYATYRFLCRHRKATLNTLLASSILCGLTAYYLYNLDRSESQIAGLTLQVENKSSEVNQLTGVVVAKDQERRVLSQSLMRDMMTTASERRDDLMWRLHPVKNLNADLALANRLYQEHPDDPTIRYNWFYLNFITLNFKVINEANVEGAGSFVTLCQDVARAFPQHDFGPYQEPSASELCDVFEFMLHYLREQSSSQKKGAYLASSTLRYNLSRLDRPDNDSVFFVLRILNLQNPEFTISCSGQNAVMSFGSSLKTIHGEHCEDILGYLDLRSLKVQEGKKLDLIELQHMNIEELDVSGVEEVRVSNYVRTFGLKKVIIKKGTISRGEILKMIRHSSRQELEIIVVE